MREWLIEKRKAIGLTQTQIASIAGISQQQLSFIESGERGASVPTAKKIAAALGFDWQRFYEDETDADTASEGR